MTQRLIDAHLVVIFYYKYKYIYVMNGNTLVAVTLVYLVMIQYPLVTLFHWLLSPKIDLGCGP